MNKESCCGWTPEDSARRWAFIEKCAREVKANPEKYREEMAYHAEMQAEYLATRELQACDRGRVA